MTPKALDLFEAYNKDQLPKDQAYIVSSFVNTGNGCTIYEVISYSAVKAIYPDGEGLTFQSSGKKMHILIEPPSYAHKAIEPYLREKSDMIPLRFNELELHTARNQAKIFIAKKPIESLSSFTVARPKGLNISFVFYNNEDLHETLEKFFEKTFNKDSGVPQLDAAKASKLALGVIQNHMSFKGNFV